MSNPLLTVESVLSRAQEKTGLSDFGPDDFRPGLEKLMQTYTQNDFSEQGDRQNRKRIVDLLSARLRIENAFKLHPEIRDEKISRPMFLTGLPRTGTSALLNLLANDPAARPLKLWEGLNPEPLEDLKPGEEDPRYVMMKSFFENQDPEFQKIHSTSADTPEECIHLLNHTFCDVQFGVETMMEPYASWFMQQNLKNSYSYYADILRMLQWQRPGDRWLLKTPGHLLALDVLVELFPDCSLVITHRNPLECVTSYASMMASMMKNRESFDLTTLGPVVMEYLAKKLERSFKAREDFGDDRVIDIMFDDFISDPLATVNSIYDHFDLPFDDNTKALMTDYANEHPMGKHGKHEYKLEQYGLTETMILDRFEFYLKRFSVL